MRIYSLFLICLLCALMLITCSNNAKYYKYYGSKESLEFLWAVLMEDVELMEELLEDNPALINIRYKEETFRFFSNRLPVYNYKVKFDINKIRLWSLRTASDLRYSLQEDDDNGWYKDCNALHFAALKGKLKSAECLVKRGADVNSKSKGGYTPLHYFAESHGTLKTESQQMLDLLIENGADAKIQSIYMETPLHLAVRYGTPPFIERIGSYCQDFDSPDACGKTPIIKSIEYQNTDAFEYLISKNCNINQRYSDCRKEINTMGAKPTILTTGNTLLHAAVINENLEIAEILLKNNSSPFIPNSKKETAYGLAISGEDVDRFHLLNKKIEFINLFERYYPDYKTSHDVDPHILIKYFRNLDSKNIDLNRIHKYLKSVDINAYENESGTALCKAIDHQSPQLVELFLKKGAIPNLDCGRFYRNTPIVYAAANCDLESVKLLHKYGADINGYPDDQKRYLYKNSPVYAASMRRCNNGTILYLLKNGADIEWRPPQSQVILTSAVDEHNVPLVKYLLEEKNFNPNKIDMNGSSPWAILREHLKHDGGYEKDREIKSIFETYNKNQK